MVRAALTVALLLGPLSSSASASSDLEACFLAGINSQRAANGTGSLVASGTLTVYGRAHSEAMAATGDIYHSSHDDLAPHLPAGWRSWGENVGMASDSATCQPLLNALLASPDHRANLLDPAFDVAGIGVFVDAGGAIWTTHVFVAIDAPTTTTTTVAVTTTTTTTTVPSTTSTLTTPTTTTLAPASTTSTAPTTVAPTSTTTQPIAALKKSAPTTTAAAATTDIPSPEHEDTPTTATAGGLPPTAPATGDGRAAAPASRVAPAGDSAMASTPATPHGPDCRAGSCLGFVITTVGLAGLAIGAMARWAVRR